MVLPKTGPSRPRNWPFSRTPTTSDFEIETSPHLPATRDESERKRDFFLFSFPKPDSLTQATPPLAKQPRTVTSPGHLTLTRTHTHSIKRNGTTNAKDPKGVALTVQHVTTGKEKAWSRTLQ